MIEGENFGQIDELDAQMPQGVKLSKKAFRLFDEAKKVGLDPTFFVSKLWKESKEPRRKKIGFFGNAERHLQTLENLIISRKSGDFVNEVLKGRSGR